MLRAITIAIVTLSFSGCVTLRGNASIEASHVITSDGSHSSIVTARVAAEW